MYWYSQVQTGNIIDIPFKLSILIEVNFYQLSERSKMQCNV